MPNRVRNSVLEYAFQNILSLNMSLKASNCTSLGKSTMEPYSTADLPLMDALIAYTNGYRQQRAKTVSRV